MKTQIQTLIASLDSLASQLPDNFLRLFELRIPASGGDVFYNSSNGDLNHWGQWVPNLYPGSVYDNALNRVTLIASQLPVGFEVMQTVNDGSGESQTLPHVIEWTDQGLYDPMIEATATISRLQETEVVLREELTRQGNQIAELQQRIAATNAAIDAAQGQA